jgi:hypothetical protein
LAKTKQKNRSEIEAMRGYVRELEKEIRSLRKQLRSYEKYEQTSQDESIQTDTEDTHVELKFSIPCSDCGKGKMIETLNLGIRGIFGECGVCGFKGRMK